MKIEFLDLEVRKLPPQIFNIAINSKNENNVEVKNCD
jgi:hypothetical protein